MQQRRSAAASRDQHQTTRTQTKIMSDINFDAARQQLRNCIKTYQRPLRGKFAVLAPLRDELVELHKKGATGAEIAAMLAQCQVTVSKDTVARFLRMETAKERGPRPKKAAAQAPAGGSGTAPARPMLPRGLSTANE